MLVYLVKIHQCNWSQLPSIGHGPSLTFSVEGFILFIEEWVREEDMGDSGEDMQQKSKGRNQTLVAAIRTRSSLNLSNQSQV